MSYDYLTKLNTKQREAVNATSGPFYLVAGAGTGKTTTLVSRFINIVEKKSASVYEILAVTFTNKAANEMKERLAQHFSFDPRQIWVSTFHSFCNRVLRFNIVLLDIGRNSNFDILDDDDSKIILRRINKSFNNKLEKSGLKQIHDLISIYKSSEEYPIFTEPTISEVFDDYYNEYENELRRNNALDFDDLIRYTKLLFLTKPDIANIYASRFKYIMIDEFQDTSKVQFELIKPIVNAYHNLFVVGDPDQSIYAFRGADSFSTDNFVSSYREAKILILDDNYRSHQAILDLANKLIKINNSRFREKELKSNLKVTASVKKLEFDSEIFESSFIVNDIIRKLKNSDYSPKDFAILYRNGFISNQFEFKLRENNLAFKIYGGLKFYERREVKDMLSILILLTNENNLIAFRRLFTNIISGIGEKTLESIASFHDPDSKSIFQTLENVKLSPRARTAISNVQDKFVELRVLFEKSEAIESIVKDAFDIFDLTNCYKDELNPEERKENILFLAIVIKDKAKDIEFNGDAFEFLAAIINEIRLESIQKNSDIEDCITLSTIHQAKGLEFRSVYLPALEAGVFPMDRDITRSDLEEERRVLYVGITRAKEDLIISYCRSRYMYGTRFNTGKSIFIDEMFSLNGMREKFNFSLDY